MLDAEAGSNTQPLLRVGIVFWARSSEIATQLHAERVILHPRKIIPHISSIISPHRAPAKMRYASCSQTSLRHPHLFLLLRASRIAQLSSSTSRPHPGSPILFLPALHPILYLISAVSTSRGPTLRHCVVRCPPISSCASGERPRGCVVCGHTSLSACRVIRELLPPSPAQPPCEL